MSGGVQGPQPMVSQRGLGTCGASQSPSCKCREHKSLSLRYYIQCIIMYRAHKLLTSSSSQSEGFDTAGSGTVVGTVSSQDCGLVAWMSTIFLGCDSSQLSGFTALVSYIIGWPIQVDGLKSRGSSISFGGLIGGERSCKRLP